jgi:hypothetical protein
LVDLVVAFFFTRPVTVIASRTAWFNSDSKFTGVSQTMLREGLPQRAATPAGRGK